MSRIVGNYTLGALLGRGGASEVYAAEHRFLGDPVAIKLLRAGTDAVAGAGDAFMAEATRTRAIEHPAIVRVLDAGHDPASGCWYLVMERVDGETLAARLGRTGRLPEDQVRRLGAAIADGMQAAHDRGIVHRDLKPANIVLQGDRPTVIDFGIATHLDGQAAVTTGRRIGTPAYMAPEQLAGGLIGPFVDIWALGATLFEAVTGRLPFQGYDDGRCPQLFEAAPRAAELAAVSPALDALLTRCLEREPGRRPTSMAEVASALRAAPDAGERYTVDLGPTGDPLAPEPASSRRRRWPWIGVAFATAAVLAAVAVAAGRAESSASTTTDARTPAAISIDAGAPVPSAAADAALPRPDAAPLERTEVEPVRDRPRPKTKTKTRTNPEPTKPGPTEETLD